MKVMRDIENVRTFYQLVKYETIFFGVFSYQCWRVLVRPKGLGDGPVTNRNTGFRVWPHIDKLVTTMPRLHPGLLRLRSSIWRERGVRLKGKKQH